MPPLPHASYATVLVSIDARIDSLVLFVLCHFLNDAVQRNIALNVIL